MNQFSGSMKLSPDADPGAAMQPAKLLSGKIWVSMFPGLKTLDVLTSPFKENISAFIRAMQDSSVGVNITATLRPPQRAYLMHFSFLIAKGRQDPASVPPMKDVHIEWFHGNTTDSVKAAKEMVASYGIATSTTAPALQSNHIAGNAVDMRISSFAGKEIKKANGSKTIVNSFDDLIKVGETYSVFHKLPDDMPHWSVTGR